MKYFTINILFTVYLILAISCSQPDNQKALTKKENVLIADYKKNLDKCAKAYTQAVTSHDGKKAIQYMYPKLPEYLYETNKSELNSVEDARKFLIQQISDLANKAPTVSYFMNYTVDTILKQKIIKDVVLLQAKSSLHTIAEDKGKKMDLILPDTLIAISYDKGLNWYFISKSDESKDVLKLEFPENALEDIVE